MAKIVISTNASLDGVVQDPDGEEGFRLGGWFREFGGDDLDEWARLFAAEALAPMPCCWAGAATHGSRRGGWAAAASGPTG